MIKESMMNLSCHRTVLGFLVITLLGVGTSIAPVSAAAPEGMGQKLPSGHPKIEHAPVTSLAHPQSGSHYKLEIDPKITAQWKAVKLGLSVQDEKERIEIVPIGGQVRFGVHTVKVIAFAPHWMSNDGVVRSASAKPINPAVLLSATVDKKPIEGWVFENLPEFNSFPGKPLKVRLLGGIHVEK